MEFLLSFIQKKLFTTFEVRRELLRCEDHTTESHNWFLVTGRERTDRRQWSTVPRDSEQWGKKQQRTKSAAPTNQPPFVTMGRPPTEATCSWVLRLGERLKSPFEDYKASWLTDSLAHWMTVWACSGLRTQSTNQPE